MKLRAARLVALCILIAALGAAAVSAGVDPVSRRDAARLQAKIDKINKNGWQATIKPHPLRPAVEGVVNDMLKNPIGNVLWRNDGEGCGGWCWMDASASTQSNSQRSAPGFCRSQARLQRRGGTAPSRM